MIDDFLTDLEKAQNLQNILISKATGGFPDESDYVSLRQFFLEDFNTKSMVPPFVRTCRDLSQFWQFIKKEVEGYANRRRYIWDQFDPLLSLLEGRNVNPADNTISDALVAFDEDSVHNVWTKALARRSEDPDGAITAARTLLETVCKHILDLRGVIYDSRKIEIHELYKLVAKELNLSASQHDEEVFKQILGGCSAVVSGLGTLRNRLGDAHGQGKNPVKPAPRHAELAVNLAGSMALFLVSTWGCQQKT